MENNKVEKKEAEENMTEELNLRQEPEADVKEGGAEEAPRAYVERKRWLFFGLPFTFTKYTVNEYVVTINAGLFNTTENDCYLYKIQDVELRTSLAERIFGLGTVACYTGDNTHPQLFLEHIKHAREVKNYILQMSEEARRKRRTLNTLNIDAHDIDEM